MARKLTHSIALRCVCTLQNQIAEPKVRQTVLFPYEAMGAYA